MNQKDVDSLIDTLERNARCFDLEESIRRNLMISDEKTARIADLESDLAEARKLLADSCEIMDALLVRVYVEARKREQELSEMLAECHAYFVIRNLGSKADALQDQIAKVVNKQEGKGTL